MNLEWVKRSRSPVLSIVVPSINDERSDLVLKRCLNHIEKNTLVSYELVVVKNDREGFVKPVNAGIQASKGKFVCVLNNDCFVEKEWYVKALELLEQDKSVGVVGPLGNARRKNGFAIVSFWCAFLRKEMIEKIGVMDERLWMYFNDDEYCIRAQKTGWKVAAYAVPSHHLVEYSAPKDRDVVMKSQELMFRSIVGEEI